MSATDAAALARRLLEAFDEGKTLAPISASHPDFDVASAYDVLGETDRLRIARGWRPVGRKIGFTNRSLWPRYGVDRPMWAHVWAQTVVDAPDGVATVSLERTTEPRIEPEVVLGLGGPVPADADARGVLDAVAWIAAGFEIVQSPFPGWKFTSADCTAAFGLHRALVVGPRVALTGASRDTLAAALSSFELVLRRGDEAIEEGVGANVLDSPALALGHLASLLRQQPRMPGLAPGELVTTGTITDAWPIRPGETWSSDYGGLGIPGIVLRLT